jgi:hypothetical protein
MSSLRVVVYAEGAGELVGELRLRRAPGDTLVDEWLGPAHLLVRRAICSAKPSLPEGAIQFEEPLRVRAREARGSDLQDPRVLRTLLSWLLPENRPDLAVVLTDADGELDRKMRISSGLTGLHSKWILGVPVQEFEAWLIADAAAASSVLGPSAAPPADVEGLERAEAKEMLGRWGGSVPNKTPREIRMSLAGIANLETLARRCPAFAAFIGDLKAALA